MYMLYVNQVFPKTRRMNEYNKKRFLQGKVKENYQNC